MRGPATAEQQSGTLGGVIVLRLSVVVALTSCLAPTGGPAGAEEPERAQAEEPPAAGEIVVVVEGGAPIPAGLRLAVMWGNDDVDPPIVVSPIATTTAAGGLRIAGLPEPPAAMLLRDGELGVAVGYIVAYQDRDGDGTLTPAADKPWRWPEFRGGVNRHVPVYASGPVREGTRAYQWIGAHPGGLELMQVELTAKCDGDACSGHDKLSHGTRPTTLTLVLPDEPASFRFPNLD